VVKLNGLPTWRDRLRRRHLDRAVVRAWRVAGHAQTHALRSRDQSVRERRLELARRLDAEAYRRQAVLLADHAAGRPS
jgi:hypothetical protein